MNNIAKSIRPFIGSKDFQVSKEFYSKLGFALVEISKNMVLFRVDNNLSFYLQDYYHKEWIDNSMIFLEVNDLDNYYQELLAKDLPSQYDIVRLTGIKSYDWGRECFMHDPSGILWHFGEFAT